MMLLDVNVLIGAHRPESPSHAEIKHWLEDQMSGAGAFGAADGIFCGFVRIVTRSPFAPPTPVAQALDFVAQVRAAPSCREALPNPRQWNIFDRLCRSRQLGGKSAQDAYWASFALDLDCEWITFDGGFVDIPGLRWRSPLEPHARTNPR